MTSQLLSKSPIELIDEIAAGTLTSLEVVEACCARIEERDSTIQAWAWYNRQYAVQQAKELDQQARAGAPLGPLHGLPVAVKDIIDTAGIPTENGCALDKGRVPDTDAIVVQRLKAAGAVIMGKTVTTELAFLRPSKTRNPCNTDHTPGGSSSGSAAAVADGMVPFALGTQTGGSVIRPAAFCGVVGLKPQFGSIPSEGVLVQSPSLDTVGVFARDPESAGFLTSVLTEEMQASAQNGRDEIQNVPANPVFGFLTLPGWDKAEGSVHNSFDTLRQRLGTHVLDLPLPESFKRAADERAKINAAEMAFHFQRYYDRDEGHLGAETRQGIEDGLGLSAQQYLSAKWFQSQLAAEAERLFAQCDVLLCPSTLGPAPETLASTGDSIFNGVWTLTGNPAVTLPLFTAPNDLPLGVQLVARTGDHDGLVAAARWLWMQWSKY